MGDHFPFFMRIRLSLLILFCPVFCLGQKRMHYEAVAGISMQTAPMEFAGSHQFQRKQQAGIGAFAGIYSRYAFHDRISAGIGLFVQGITIKNEFSDQHSMFQFTNRFYSISIPLAAQYHFSKIRLGAGPLLHIPFSANQLVSVTENAQVTRTQNSANALLQRFLIGLHGSVGYEIAQHWTLRLGYEIVPQSLFKEPNYNNQYFGAGHFLRLGFQFEIR